MANLGFSNVRRADSLRFSIQMDDTIRFNSFRVDGVRVGRGELPRSA